MLRRTGPRECLYIFDSPERHLRFYQSFKSFRKIEISDIQGRNADLIRGGPSRKLCFVPSMLMLTKIVPQYAFGFLSVSSLKPGQSPHALASKTCISHCLRRIVARIRFQQLDARFLVKRLGQIVLFLQHHQIAFVFQGWLL